MQDWDSKKTRNVVSFFFLKAWAVYLHQNNMGIVFFIVLLFYPINNKEFPGGAQMERTICVNKMCQYHTILNQKQRSS